MITIHGKIISQSLPLLTLFYSDPIVQWTIELANEPTNELINEPTNERSEKWNFGGSIVQIMIQETFTVKLIWPHFVNS